MPPRTVLAVETSTRKGSVALLRAGAPVEERFLDPGSFQGKDLAPAAAEILRAAGVEPRAVELVAVGLGPGSFTGLRVGIAFARAFAYGAGCPVVGVSSFDALAAARRGRPGERVLCTAPAGREEVYYALYTLGEAGAPPVPEAGPAVAGLAEAAALAEGAAAVIGAAAGAVRAPGVEGGADAPSAAAVARLGLARHAAEGPTPPESLLPLYLRRSKAEINWERRGKGGGPVPPPPPGGGGSRGRD